MPEAPYNPELIRVLKDPQLRMKFWREMNAALPDERGERRVVVQSKSGKKWDLLIVSPQGPR
jgi:hypothetical protein